MAFHQYGYFWITQTSFHPCPPRFGEAQNQLSACCLATPSSVLCAGWWLYQLNGVIG